MNYLNGLIVICGFILIWRLITLQYRCNHENVEISKNKLNKTRTYKDHFGSNLYPFSFTEYCPEELKYEVLTIVYQCKKCGKLTTIRS